LCKIKKTTTETFQMLKCAHVEEYLLRTSVYEWHKSFKEGRESLQNDERKSHPSTSWTEESTEVIQKCLAEDRTFSVWMLEEMIGTIREST
jgi:transposase